MPCQRRRKSRKPFKPEPNPSELNIREDTYQVALAARSPDAGIEPASGEAGWKAGAPSKPALPGLPCRQGPVACVRPAGSVGLFARKRAPMSAVPVGLSEPACGRRAGYRTRNRRQRSPAADHGAAATSRPRPGQRKKCAAKGKNDQIGVQIALAEADMDVVPANPSKPSSRASQPSSRNTNQPFGRLRHRGNCRLLANTC
jgi:hypothetical protein